MHGCVSLVRLVRRHSPYCSQRLTLPALERERFSVGYTAALVMSPLRKDTCWFSILLSSDTWRGFWTCVCASQRIFSRNISGILLSPCSGSGDAKLMMISSRWEMFSFRTAKLLPQLLNTSIKDSYSPQQKWELPLEASLLPLFFEVSVLVLYFSYKMCFIYANAQFSSFQSFNKTFFFFCIVYKGCVLLSFFALIFCYNVSLLKTLMRKWR